MENKTTVGKKNTKKARLFLTLPAALLLTALIITAVVACVNKQSDENIKGEALTDETSDRITPPDEETTGKTSAATLTGYKTTDKLSAVTGLTAQAYDGGVKLTWNDVSGAFGYCVFRLQDGKYSTYKFSQTPSKSFTGLTNGTEYTFAVAAYLTEDDTECYGPLSENISVIPENNVIKISDTFIVMHSGETKLLQCLLYDQPQQVSWSSQNPEVASVKSDGTVTAVGKGETVITAVKGDDSLECTVCVDREAPEPRVDTSARFTMNKDGVWTNSKSTKKDSAVIMFTGDLMALGKQMTAALQDDGYYDFSTSFSQVGPIFSQADMLVGNLETMLSQSFPYSCELSKYMGISNCNSTPSYLDALKKAGFDMLVAANNHYCDAGPAGILETLDHLDNYNFMHLGIYRNENEPRIIIADINGMRVGFLNYNIKGTNGKIGMFSNEERTAMLGSYNEKRAAADIEKARALGAEFLIVYMHYGTQNSVTVSEKQEEINLFLADHGVDMIVGSHPHLLQKFSYVTASDGRKVPVAFSLGNFCSNMSELDLNRYNIILKAQLVRGKDGKISVDLSYIPCCILKSTDAGKFIITPTSYKDGLSAKNIQDLEKAETEIIRIVGDEIPAEK